MTPAHEESPSNQEFTEVVADRSPAPHHALVMYSHYFCSGSFIASKIVLTVASCFDKDTTGSDIIVKFGCKHILDEGQIIPVAEKKEHEFFQYKSELDNDIALLILERHVRFNGAVKKIIVVEPDIALPDYSTLVVTGWGTKDFVKSQDKFIHRTSMTLLQQAECSEAYKSTLTSSMFCAKYDVKNRLSDSGGAAVYNGLAVGIASYGAPNDKKPHIALFTNISYFYKWIKLNSERLLTKYCSEEYEDSEG